MVTIDDGSWRAGDAQSGVHGVMAQRMMVAREALHWSWRYELMERSSLRRDSNGDDSDGVLGMSVMMGGEQAE